jgi:hypothetical protein
MQIVVLLIAFGFVMFFARRNAPTRGCRWRADATGDRGALRKYNCVACGAEAFTSPKGPPNDCRSKLKTPNL